MPQPLPLVPDRKALFADSMKSLGRAAWAISLKALSRSQYSARADRILAEDPVADAIVKAATSPTTMATAPGLTQVAIALVDALIPVSASAALLARSLRLSFDGNARVTVPGLSIPTAGWISEGSAIPVTNGVSSIAATLDPFKLACLVELTGEILRSSNVEALVRAALLNNIGPVLDASMFNANAGTPGLSPAGLLHNVAPITPAAGGDFPAMVSDVQALAGALAPVAGNGGICLIANIKQAVALAMVPPGDVPFPVFSSSVLPAGELIAVAAQALCSIVSAPQIEASDAALVQEQTTPTGDVMTGSPIRSYFQTDSIGLRLKLPCSWALRSPNGVAYITGTSW